MKAKHLLYNRITKATTLASELLNQLETAYNTRGIRAHQQTLLIKPIRLLTQAIGELKNAGKNIDIETETKPDNENIQENDEG